MKPAAEKKIVSFEIVTLKETGMRGSSEYEITREGDAAKVSFYVYRYGSGKEERVLCESRIAGVDEILTLLNGCGVLSWDGFDGPHPKHVLDGTMFRFSAVLNGGVKISACGSENFPKNYRVFTDGLYGLTRR